MEASLNIPKPLTAGDPVRIVRKPGEKHNGEVGRLVSTTAKTAWVAIDKINPYNFPSAGKYLNQADAKHVELPITALKP